MVLPRAALTPIEVVLEVRVTGADLRNPGERGVGEWRASQVRVHEHPGRVQHPTKGRLAFARELFEHRIDQRTGIASGADLRPSPLENRTRSRDRGLVRLF